VWNTSRVRELADPAYQARLQAITWMAFTLGFSVGMLWAGTAIDLLAQPTVLPELTPKRLTSHSFTLRGMRSRSSLNADLRVPVVAV
jgi:hypothetical protein